MAVVVRFHEFGGPEVLRAEEEAVSAPGPGEVRLRQEAIGVNFIDLSQRSGQVVVPLPAILGSEAAGVVTEVGDEVTDVQIGDRVAYGGSAPGSYASDRVIAAELVVKLPVGIDSVTAAGAMSAGLTAGYLLRRMWPLKRGDAILLTAAAGSVGQITTQWAKALGLNVIGTVGSASKIEAATAAGCDHVLVHGVDDIAARVNKLTNGVGVAVAFDSVGAETFDASLASVRRRGLVVSFGSASGPVPAVDLLRLSAQGSVFISRPSMMDYVHDPVERASLTHELLGHLQSGLIKVDIRHSFPLADAAQAHRDIEARRTTGSVILTV